MIYPANKNVRHSVGGHYAKGYIIKPLADSAMVPMGQSSISPLLESTSESLRRTLRGSPPLGPQLESDIGRVQGLFTKPPQDSARFPWWGYKPGRYKNPTNEASVFYRPPTREHRTPASELLCFRQNCNIFLCLKVQIKLLYLSKTSASSFPAFKNQVL